MTDLNTLLKEGDPVRGPEEDEGLSAVDAQRMRRIVVAEAAEPTPARTPWRRPFAVATVASLLVTVATMTGDRLLVRHDAAPAPLEPSLATGGGGDDRRQLQFATPGGTRIIWIFDQNLRLQESMP